MPNIDSGTSDPKKMPWDLPQVLSDRPSSSLQPPSAKSPMLQEVFNLDEGPVTLSFPNALSRDSYEDLKDQLELFLRRAQRRAAVAPKSGAGVVRAVDAGGSEPRIPPPPGDKEYREKLEAQKKEAAN